MSMTKDADDATFARAQSTVLGVVKARQTGNENDAALLIGSFLEEETSLGRSLPSAWASLFSASTVWVDALITSDARRNNMTPAARLSQLALAHASEQS